MATTVSGMPLLSGPPPGPDANETACRKCNKEFNVIFARSRKCNHCGHLFCQSCTDYQALMPRQGGGNAGYDPVPVCAYCIENLTITAAGKGQLRKYSLAKLRKYAKDYNINVNGVIEKDDLIDKIIAARAPNGCMPPVNEKYYRLYSVPQPSSDRPRGIFTRAMEAMAGAPSGSTSQHQHQPAHQQQVPPYQTRQRTTSHPSFPRPDLDDRPPRDNAPPRWAQHTPPPQPPQPQPPRQPPPQQQQQQQRPSPAPGAGGYTHNYQTYNSQSRRQYQPPPGPPPGGPNPPNPQYTPQYNPPPGPPPGHNPRQRNWRGPNHNAPPGGQRPRSASASASGGSAPHSPPQASGASTRGASPAGTSTPAAAPVPTLDELLALAPEALGALSVSALKAVLFRNHVHTGVVVEKAELVAKVRALVDAERREREAARRRAEMEEAAAHRTSEEREEAEMQEVLERSRREDEEFERRREEARREEEEQQAQAQEASASAAPDAPAAASQEAHDDADADKGKAGAPKLSAKAQAMASHLERTGLCVVCQDEEANIAIVDCGHLAMCRACADLVMGSTRECPLCRTRIVTEARLLRIFKP